jgi:LPXTG-site transpeptidase (sortase) family protein
MRENFHKIYTARSIFRYLVMVIIFGAFIVSMYEIQTTQQKRHGDNKQGNSEILSENEPIHIGKGFHEKKGKEKPLRIVIPKLGIDIAIVEAPLVQGSWEVSQRNANHGEGSAYPGQKGNMVIFAHARIHLFLPLHAISKNDDIYVLTDKKWYVYSVNDIIQVVPTQTTLINPTSDERLTLFTCSGFSDEKRLIVIGKRVHSLATN